MDFRSGTIYTIRTAHQNQTQLNVMADQKANIIVGAILIFLTLFLTRISSFDLTNTRLTIFLGIFISLEIIALFLAILVIKPRAKWSNHKLTLEDMPNPLFFGFYTRFPEQEYIDFMLDKLVDNRAARELLLRDIYQIGQVLKRKFTLLKYAYNFAAGGILIGVLSAAVELIGNS
ncbi:MAG: hypothetical protein H8E21_17395 [Gammaproteobacteria bacterium]|nr:hypothetical protein [Gammaproteobacteria bacterium]